MTALPFTSLPLREELQKAIADLGYSSCTPVQAQAIPTFLAGNDILAQSQTGTGKTAAFLVPLLNDLLENEQGRRQALIVAPTRELAVQIKDEALSLARYTDISVGCFYGGTGYNAQMNQLRDGVDVLIGTPGRIIDFGKQGLIRFKNIGTVILDEADRLLDMGFLPDIRYILDRLPPTSQRQSMLFSATLDHRVRKIAAAYMREPVEIDIEPEDVTVKLIDQQLYHVGTQEKVSLLLGLLARHQPRNVLIFTNMKYKAEEVAARLEFNGLPARYLSGDLPQNKRERVIEQFKEGTVRILVATDVAARGIHVDDLEMVINYDVPEHSENYVHRIGRTARAGKSGQAITLGCEDYVLGLPAVEEYIKMKIPVAVADEGLFLEDKSSSQYSSQSRRRPRRAGDSRRGSSSQGSSGRSRSSGGRPSGSRPSSSRSSESRSSGGRSSDSRPADSRSSSSRSPNSRSSSEGRTNSSTGRSNSSGNRSQTQRYRQDEHPAQGGAAERDTARHSPRHSSKPRSSTSATPAQGRQRSGEHFPDKRQEKKRGFFHRLVSLFK